MFCGAINICKKTITKLSTHKMNEKRKSKVMQMTCYFDIFLFLLIIRVCFQQQKKTKEKLVILVISSFFT